MSLTTSSTTQTKRHLSSKQSVRCFLKKKNAHFDTNLMSDIVSTQNLNQAYDYICKARSKDHHNSDIWSLRGQWEKIRPKIQDSLLRGTYNLSPLSIFKTPDGIFTKWDSVDAVVMKAVSLKVSKILENKISPRCYHLQGRGGLKGAVRITSATLTSYKYVLKSDVADYYQSMDHATVLNQLRTVIQDKRVLAFIAQYLNRVEVYGGVYALIEKGIPKGFSLSPLVGAVMLKSLDDVIPPHAFYVRYMDDWVILVKTRGQLRRLVKKMHQVMHNLKFKLALDKTYIGKIENGFDFLGYRFGGQGLSGLAQKTWDNFKTRMRKLYEQGAPSQRLCDYTKHWYQWAIGGLDH